MIDQLTIFLPHALMAIAIWRLVRREDLDDDPALPSRKTLFRKSAKGSGTGDA